MPSCWAKWSVICPRPRHLFEQAAWRPSGAARRGRADLSYSVLGVHPTARLIGHAYTSCGSVSPSLGRDWNPMNLARFPDCFYAHPFAACPLPSQIPVIILLDLLVFPFSLWLDR